MSFDYTTTCSSTPAPVLLVSIFKPLTEDGSEFEALIDTGADFTCIPSKLVGELHLKPHREIRIKGVNCERDHRQFLVKISILNRKYDVTAVEIENKCGLIGRDILNQLILTLDGLNERFDVKQS